MHKENCSLIDDNVRIQRIVTASDEVDYYNRLHWFVSIRQKRDAAVKYFESLLICNEPEQEPESGSVRSSGQIARLVMKSMTVSRSASHSRCNELV